MEKFTFPTDYRGRPHPDGDDFRPPPGQASIMMAALLIGVMLMGIQLWLLTVALDLYLGGRGSEVWQMALLSGGIFAGGLAMIKLTHRRSRIHHSHASNR